MTSGAPSNSPGDESGLPDCFLPESSLGERWSDPEEDLVAEDLPDEGKLLKVLAFGQEPPPSWGEEAPGGGAPTIPEEVDGLRAEDFTEEYGTAFHHAKGRLSALITGFEREKREALDRVEQLRFASEALQFHLGQLDQVKTTGLPRLSLIRELEKGLVLLKSAEEDLELETARAGLANGRGAAAMPKAGAYDWLRQHGRFSPMRLLAFFLPLLIFAIIALILIGTALGWF